MGAFKCSLDTGMFELEIYTDEGIKKLEDQPIAVSDDRLNLIKILPDTKYLYQLHRNQNIRILITEKGSGEYGELKYEIEVENTGITDFEQAVFPPFCSWIQDDITNVSQQHMYLADLEMKKSAGKKKAYAYLGSAGKLLVHSIGSVFAQSQFVTIPIENSGWYACAFMRMVEGEFPLKSHNKCLYELYIHSGKGNRNDALREIFRERGCYRFDPAKYDYSEYERLPWVKDIVAAFLNFAWDRDVMDPVTGEYHMADFMIKSKQNMGGYDVYTLWPFWPRAGFDSRLQYEHYKDMPGGLTGLGREIERLHKIGTRVILGYCYWSEYDRFGKGEWEEKSSKAYEELIEITNEISADGFVMDCLDEVPEPIIQLSKKLGKDFLPYNEWDPGWIESQKNLLGRIHDSVEMPEFNLKKFVAPHHPILRVIGPGLFGKRMRNEITLGFLNGHGFEVNQMFGENNPDGKQDWLMLSRALDIMRTHRENFRSAKWEPMVESLDKNVWINKWPGRNKIIYTVCGTHMDGHRGPLLKLPHQQGLHYVDLWRYREIMPETEDTFDIVSYRVDGYEPGLGCPIGTADYSPGCIAVFPDLLDVRLKGEVLRIQIDKQVTGDCFVEIWKKHVCPEVEPVVVKTQQVIEVNVYEQYGYTNDAFIIRLMDEHKQVLDIAVVECYMVRIFKTTKAKVAPHFAALRKEEAILVPGGEFTYEVEESQPVWQYTYVNDRASHKGLYSIAKPYVEHVTINSFYMERFNVTNYEFVEFVKETGYLQGDDVDPIFKQNFLKHLPGLIIPEGMEKHPVVYVSYEDALAYCRWSGKRLPTEVEWQYAAGWANDRRIYPWGYSDDPEKYNSSGTCTQPVDAHLQGTSPFGIEDMAGNIWQWTLDKYTNGHHEIVYLRGGSWFQSPVGDWWVKGGLRKINDHHPIPLFGPGMNRLATVGFRCVMDLDNPV